MKETSGTFEAGLERELVARLDKTATMSLWAVLNAIVLLRLN